MSETLVEYKALQRPCEPDTINIRPPDTVLVSRRELEQEHNHLMARVQQLRRILGYPPLPTGSQRRRQHE